MQAKDDFPPKSDTFEDGSSMNIASRSNNKLIEILDNV